MQKVECRDDRIEDHDDPQLDEPLPTEKEEDRREKKTEHSDNIDRIPGKEPDASCHAQQEPCQQFPRAGIQRADSAADRPVEKAALYKIKNDTEKMDQCFHMSSSW